MSDLDAEMLEAVLDEMIDAFMDHSTTDQLCDMLYALRIVRKYRTKLQEKVCT